MHQDACQQKIIVIPKTRRKTRKIAVIDKAGRCKKQSRCTKQIGSGSENLQYHDKVLVVV